MGRYVRLLAYLRPYRALFAVSFVAAVVASILDGYTLALLIPFLRLLFGAATSLAETPTMVERVLDFTVGGFFAAGDAAGALRAVVLVILAAVAIKNVAVYTTGYVSQYLEERVGCELRLALHSHIQRLELGYLQRVKGGQLLSRVVSDTDQAKWVVSAALVSVLQNAVLIGVYLVVLFSLSWRLSVVTLVVAPITVLLLRPILRRVRVYFSRALDERGELTAVMGEAIEGARLVKAHAAEAHEHRRFKEVVERYFTEMLRAQKFVVMASPLSETIGAAVIVLLLLVGSQAAMNGQALRPEVFITFIVVSLRLLRPVKTLSQFPALAEQALAASERIFEVLDHPSVDVDDDTAVPFPGLRDRIEMRDVWAAYDGGEWVLCGVNLTLERGQVVALVGPSGAGKSTLADLLPRFVDPRRGLVTIDAIPITRYSRRSLRRSLGIVSQHTVIFNDTVRNNIAYGEQADASLDAVEATARAAHAHAFIERLPNGYDTRLGERGMRLSGGERQRIAIARALLRDPPILILDEATSNLDPESERLVQSAIAKLLEGRTVLVIAHRLTTVARADVIAVLDGGRVVERGRHDELIVAGGLYQRLHVPDEILA
jgi:subfamily B ATP-binding cassette protein MsbA